MEIKSDEKLLIIQATIESNRQYYDEKVKKLTEKLTSMIASIIDHIKISKSSPEKKDSPKAQYPNTVVPANKKARQLKGGHYTKIGGMWTIKHDIITPKFYELLINTELRGDTDIDLKNFYKHTNMYINLVCL